MCDQTQDQDEAQGRRNLKQRHTILLNHRVHIAGTPAAPPLELRVEWTQSGAADLGLIIRLGQHHTHSTTTRLNEAANSCLLQAGQALFQKENAWGATGCINTVLLQNSHYFTSLPEAPKGAHLCQTQMLSSEVSRYRYWMFAPGPFFSGYKA